MLTGHLIEETTTAIASSGAGIVTLTAQSGIPAFVTLGNGPLEVCYSIHEPATGKYESGVGTYAYSGGVGTLTRTGPQHTFNGSSTYLKGPAISALAFTASPSAGAILIRLSPRQEDFAGSMTGRQTTIAGDGVYDTFPLSSHIWGANNGGGRQAMTLDREFYQCHYLEGPGLITGIRFDVATAGSNLKAALYDMGRTGLPKNKILDFPVIGVGSTGVTSETTPSTWTPVGGVWVRPGWYYIGLLSNNTSLVLKGAATQAANRPTPVGRKNGYGYSDTVWVGGSYASGLPNAPSLGSGTMIDIGAGAGNIFLGLRVAP